MEKKNKILRISLALVLVLLSVAMRTEKFADAVVALHCSAVLSSDFGSSSDFISTDDHPAIHLICADDASDDDGDVFLLVHNDDSTILLSIDLRFGYRWQTPNCAVLYSSDVSPPVT